MPRLHAHHRTAFVTGVSSGLGRAITEMLLAEGVRVWGTAPRGTVIAPFRQTGFTALELDLDNPAAARAVVASAESAAGGCFDLAVLNAGGGLFGPFASTDWADWERQLNALVTGNAALAHRLVAPMAARGRGSLVIVTAPAGDFQAGLAMAQPALAALAATLRAECPALGVTELRCDWLRTDFLKHMPPARILQATSPDGRLEVAWSRLRRCVETAPPPTVAAEVLRRALSSPRPPAVVLAGTPPWRRRLAKLFVWLGARPSVAD